MQQLNTTNNNEELNFTHNINNRLQSIKVLIKISFNYLWKNILFLIFICINLFQIYDLYLSYKLLSILICPIKTWSMLLAIYLRYKVIHLNKNDFNKFIDTNNLN